MMMLSGHTHTHTHHKCTMHVKNDFFQNLAMRLQIWNQSMNLNLKLTLVDVFRWLLIFLLTWQIAHCISDTAINELLESIATPFAVTSTMISSPTALGLSAIPVSLYLA